MVLPSIHVHRLFVFVESTLSIRDCVHQRPRASPLGLPRGASNPPSRFSICHRASRKSCHEMRLRLPHFCTLALKQAPPPWRRSVTAAPSSRPHPVFESATPCPSWCWPPELHQPLWWPPPWRRICRWGSDRTPGVAPRGVFRSRTVSTTVAKWFVPIARGTVDKIYRFGPLRDA
jgi:hypothetical protein